jgi:hypothetical protein
MTQDSLKQMVLATALLSVHPAASGEPIWLGCASNPNPSGVTYYLIVDLEKATVTIRDSGTYQASITGREITWSAGRTFYRLERETGRWEIHNDGVNVLQCQRRKSGSVL